MAMVCIGNPDILILDEPTTGLDPVSRRQVWEVIENVKEGRSVVSMCGSVKLWNKLILKCKVDGMYTKAWGAWYGKGWPFFIM